MMIQEKLEALRLPYAGQGSRTVRVYVPAHEEGETFPVIYMTDGQNLFEDNLPQQLGCWYVREAIRAEQESSGKAAVVVGIHNDGDPMQRTCELTPAGIGAIRFPDEMPDDMRRLLVPAGEQFDAFVLETVMPAVEAAFPVKRGSANTAFCGSSSGGLQSFFTAVSHPELFGMAGVFSPAFPLYDTKDIISWTAGKVQEIMPLLFFYSGADGALEQDIFCSTGQVYDALTEFYPPEKLNAILLPDQPHHERAWSLIFRDFLHTLLHRS